jgi:arsenate reductase-like glutaredoxin family protein
LEVQIFGTKKDSDTRKALRFFSERRIRVHFVDLHERAASLGELKRFAQKFGAEALIARTGSRFAERGLGTARYSDERWVELLAGDPMLLRTPLTRWQQRLTIGLDDAAWKEWVAADASTAPGQARSKA